MIFFLCITFISNISEFRECFYLYARSGQIQTMDELTVVMRSLNMSPTIAELRAYMKSKNGKMSFADFLDIMHQHSTKVFIKSITSRYISP